MKQKRRILHVFGKMDRGGAEMRTLDVMRHLDPTKYQLQFCALSGQRGELDDEIRALGGEVHLIPLGPGFAHRFAEVARREQADVVHSHVHLSSGFVLRIAGRLGIPRRVAHFRSVSDGRSDDVRRRMQRRLMRHWIQQYATDILAVSTGTMDAVWPQWRSDQRCQVVYNGLDVTAMEGRADRIGVHREFGLGDPRRLLIHVGRMHPSKNHLRLIDLFHAVLQREPASVLLLVGQGDNEIESRVRSRLAELAIEKHVVLAGARCDVPRLLRASDLLLFPSLWEGMPGSVLEACAVGTPVLGSDLPGICEIAAHFPSVRTLSLNDTDESWAALADTLCRQERSDSSREAASARFAASVFSVKRTVEALCSVWESSLQYRAAA